MAGFVRAGGRAARVIAVGCVLGLLATGVWWLTRSTGRTVTGYFTSAVGVFPDNEVLILGVPVGRITSVQPQGPVVKVVMRIDEAVAVPATASAVVVSPSLVAGRSIQLVPAYTTGPTMADGAVIPLERTAVPLGVDDLARATNELATMLGPNGVNRNGALSDLLDVGASTCGATARLCTTRSATWRSYPARWRGRARNCSAPSPSCSPSCPRWPPTTRRRGSSPPNSPMCRTSWPVNAATSLPR